MRRIIQKLAATALSSVLAVVFCLGPATVAQAANRFWKNSVVSPGSWINGNNWSATSAIGVDNAGAPAANDAAHIRPTDGQNHTITYDYMGAAITLGGLYVDLTGAGATTTTLSMSGNNLTSTFEYVGYNGRGTFNHSGGTNTIAAGAGFLDVADLGQDWFAEIHYRRAFDFFLAARPSTHIPSNDNIKQVGSGTVATTKSTCGMITSLESINGSLSFSSLNS